MKGLYRRATDQVKTLLGSSFPFSGIHGPAPVHSAIQLHGKVLLFLFVLGFSPLAVLSQKQEDPKLYYVVSFPEPDSHTYQVELQLSNWPADTIRMKMPRWMPGYYQLMDYARSVENMKALGKNGKVIPVRKLNDHTWQLSGVGRTPVSLRYTIRTEKQFVANSYVDSTRAYVIPENTFLYVDEKIGLPVSVKVELNQKWKNKATGLEPVKGRFNEFSAPDFDILYDCPILIGNLQELPSFKVNGIDHRFIGYHIGNFDRVQFMDNLRKIVETSAALIGDIPYTHYTFIGIGPGQGGIEHLNNTTVSFNGDGLSRPGALDRIMNFLAHEYFHHFNVKRIRPFELGPFDYENGNRTNLLWVSEGLSVYYEYLIVKRAGLSDGATLLANLSSDLTAVENNPGKRYQSLQQASYSTWSDGPFGTQGSDPAKSISYYNKGPVVGLLLDFAIRHSTGNKSSLDDVMRLLY